MINEIKTFLPTAKINKNEYGVFYFNVSLKQYKNVLIQILEPRADEENNIIAPDYIQHIFENFNNFDEKLTNAISTEIPNWYNQDWKNNDEQPNISQKDVLDNVILTGILFWPATYRCEFMYDLDKDYFSGHGINIECHGQNLEKIQVGLFG